MDLGRSGFLWSLAWRNLWRHKRRSLITATAMAVALALCMATISFMEGFLGEMFEVMVEQQLGHVQVHHPEYPDKKILYDTLHDVDDLLAGIDAVETTRAVAPRLEGFALVGYGDQSSGGQIQGIDPARERRVGPLAEQLEQGAYLPDEPARQVMVGAGLAEDLDVGIGDSVLVVTQAADGSMGNDLYEVVGTVETGQTAMDRSGVWMHLADLQELLVLPDQAHQLTALGTDEDAIDAYADAVRGALDVGAADPEPPVEVQTWYEASPHTAQMIESMNASNYVIFGIIFLAAAFGVLNTMMMSVFERTQEFGVLKAIGLRPGRMVWLVLFESVFLGAVAAAIGLVLGGGLDWLLATYGIDMSAGMEDGFSFSGVMFDPVMRGEVTAFSVLLPLGGLFLMTVLASLWPAFRAARLEPVEAIRTE